MPKHLIGCPDANKEGLVIDRSPQAVLTLSHTGNAGDTILINGSASFARQGTLRKWRIDPGDGSPLIEGSGFPPSALPYTYAVVGGQVIVTLYVEDNKGRMSIATASIHLLVPHQAPTAKLTLITGQFTTDAFKVSTEGSTAHDSNLASGSLNWGNGSPTLTWTGDPDEIYEHDYSVAGTYIVTLTLVDDVGAGQSTTLQLIVLVEPGPEPPPPPPPPPPDPPPLDPPTVVLAVSGGTEATLPWYFTATCTGNIASGTIDYGDGVIEPFTGPPLNVFSHAYGAEGPYTVTISVLDVNTLTAQDSEPITVDPPPPAPTDPPLINLTYVSGQFFGEPFVYSTDGTADPSLQVLASGSVNWGDGSAPQTWGAGLVPATLQHTYAAAGTYTILFSVTAQSGLSSSLTRDVVVQAPAVNQPPNAAISRIGGVYTTDLYTVALTASDPDGFALANWNLNWGDGTVPSSGSGNPPATRTHTYAAAGTYTASFTVTDVGGLTRTVTVALTVLPPIVVPPPSGGNNGYFDSLVANPGFVKGVSFRDPAQLISRAQGGFAQKGAPYYVNYDAGMDAAEVVVPVWADQVFALESPLTADATTLTASFLGNTGWNHRSIKFLDTGEIVSIPAKSLNATTGTLSNLLRGQRGTTAVFHAAGTQFVRNTNSLPNQVRVPVGTLDGSVYLFTWDDYYTTSCVQRAVPGKTFQFASDGIWLEPGIDPSGNTCNNASPSVPSGRIPAPGFVPGVDVGTWRTRLYNAYGGGATYSPTPFPGQAGPNVINVNPLGPSAAYIIKPNRWYRHWVQIDQRANDYDYMSQWIADAASGVVLYHSGLQIVLRNENHQVVDFWIEVNTSDDSLPANLVDLVLYVRNFAVLRNVSAAPLLVTTGL